MQMKMKSLLVRDFGHTSRGYSEDVAKTIDHEVKKIIDEAYTKAKQILEDHMDILHSCAALLMEKERIRPQRV